MSYEIHNLKGLPKVEESRKVTPENIKYGMLVEVLNYNGGYHAGCKVHFFNSKGVLVGNYYEFMPYERLRLRKGSQYQRFFMGKNYLKRPKLIGNSLKCSMSVGERLKSWLFIGVLNIMTRLLRFTQKRMD